MFRKGANDAHRYALVVSVYDEQRKDARVHGVYMGQGCAEAHLLAGMALQQRSLRSATIWMASPKIKMNLFWRYEDPELSDFWMTAQGEWELGGAQEIAARSAIEAHQDEDYGIVLQSGRKWLNSNDAKLRAAGFSGLIQGSSVVNAGDGRLSEQPGAPRA